MHEDELKTTVPGEDDYSDFLPDGWSEDKDFFDVDSWSVDSPQSGQTEESDSETDTTEDGNGDSDAPTTSENDDADSPSADAETDSTQSGQTEESRKTSRILKLKVNHEDQEVDINTMTDEELIAALQKSRAFDAMKEDQNKAKYRAIYNEQIESGMTEAAARLIAQNECGGKTYALEDEVEETPNQVTKAEQKQVEAPTTDFRSQVRQLKELYPDFREMPNEVALAVARGTDLLTAYVAYREQQTSKAAASLKKENAVLKQNAASAAKAPVKGVSGGGTAQVKVDPVMAVFDEDYW